MNYAEIQTERAARASTAPFHRAVIALRSNPKCCVCLVEGQTDFPFYRPLFNIYQSAHGCRNIIPFIAGNRSAVIYARDRIGQQEDRARFIVDRDHTGFVTQDVQLANTFITDYYSVESYVIGLNELRRFFSDLFLLNEDSVHISSLIDSYYYSYCELSKGLSSAHARVIYEKQIGNEKHISNIKPHRIFNISDGEIIWTGGSQQAACDFLLAELDINLDITKEQENEIKRLDNILRAIDPLIWLHGKIIMHHFVRFLDNWYKRMTQTEDQHGHYPSLVIQLNTSSLLNKCATFHRNVPTLTAFLDSWQSLRR